MIDLEQAQVTLAEVKKAKNEVETQISKLLTDLETKYGVKVNYVNFYNNKMSVNLSLDFE